jgi:hypothetical protein
MESANRDPESNVVLSGQGPLSLGKAAALRLAVALGDMAPDQVAQELATDDL